MRHTVAQLGLRLAYLSALYCVAGWSGTQAQAVEVQQSASQQAQTTPQATNEQTTSTPETADSDDSLTLFSHSETSRY
jgi:hypothetical protein